MPAYKEEISQAINEGVGINVSWGPKRILGNGKKVTGIELVRCLNVIDDKGKFNPSFDNNETKILEADMIILTIGQTPDLSLIPQKIKITENNTIQIDPITLETSLPGIFAGGDIVAGSGAVVEAIASGKKAAVSIDRYLKGEDVKDERYIKPNRVKIPPKEGIETMTRQQASLLPLDQRAGNFKEVKIGFNLDTMVLESQRCMTCGSRAIITYPDDCQLCLFCERDCPQKAIYVSPEKKITRFMAWD